MVYLDNAATTFPKPEVVYQTVDKVQRNFAVNIGRGSYQLANEAMMIADEARYLMAALVGVENPNNVVFTPSATLAANEIIYGLEWDEYKTVYITPFEHNAIARPLNNIKQKYNINIIQLPFDSMTHELDVSRTKLMFSKQAPDYIFLNHVSNVTGTIIPVKTISELSKEYQALIIVDAAQSAGLLELDLYRDGIDYLIFAGHKNIYASWGIGGFVGKNANGIKPILAGGTGSDSLNLSMGNKMPYSFEPGSPNIIAIASLRAALEWLHNTTIQEMKWKKSSLTDFMIKGLKERGCRLYLPEKIGDHTGVVSFNIDGYTADEVGIVLNQTFDIAVRTGYHCAPYIHSFLGTTECGGTVRASLSFFNTEADVENLLNAVDVIIGGM